MNDRVKSAKLTSKAHELIQSGDLKEGLILLEQALALRPRNQDAIVLKKQLSDLQAGANASQKRSGDDIQFHYDRGVKLYYAGHVKESEVEFRKALEIDPNFVHALNGLGNVLHDRKRYQESEVEFRKALEVDPNNLFGLNGLGVVLSNQQRYQESEVEFRKALEIDPNFVDALNGLGNVLRDQKRYQESEVEFRKALENEPNYVHALNGLGNVLLNRKLYQESEVEYRKALAIDPSFPLPYVNLAFLLNESASVQKLPRPEECISLLYHYLYLSRKDGNRLVHIFRGREMFEILRNFDSTYSLFLSLSGPEVAKVLPSIQDQLTEFKRLRTWLLWCEDLSEIDARFVSKALATWLGAPWRVPLLDQPSIAGKLSVIEIAYRFWAKSQLSFEVDDLLNEAVDEGLNLVIERVSSEREHFYTAMILAEDTEYADAYQSLVGMESLPIAYARAWLAHLSGRGDSLELLADALRREVSAIQKENVWKADTSGNKGELPVASRFLSVSRERPSHNFDREGALSFIHEWSRIHELKECRMWAWEQRKETAIASLWQELEKASYEEIGYQQELLWNQQLLSGQLDSRGQFYEKAVAGRVGQECRRTLVQLLQKSEAWWPNHCHELMTEAGFAQEILRISSNYSLNVRPPIESAILLRYLEDKISSGAAVRLLQFNALELIYNGKLARSQQSCESLTSASEVVAGGALGFLLFDALGAAASVLVVRTVFRWYSQKNRELDEMPNYSHFTDNREYFETKYLND